MITEATEILEVMEAAKGAPPLLPGLPASEYPSGITARSPACMTSGGSEQNDERPPARLLDDRLAPVDPRTTIHEQRPMRTTLNIEDELLAKAQRVSGVKERTALVREGLKALIERESARRLAKLGDSEPRLQPVPGRRSTPTGERCKASQMLRGTVVLRDDLITPTTPDEDWGVLK